MIIRRLRDRAGSVLLGLFLLLGTTALAQATADTITRYEMERFVWTSIVTTVGGGVLLGASLFAWILSRDRKQADDHRDTLIEEIQSLTRRVEEALLDLHGHNQDEDAHTRAARHNHAPMNAQAERIETAVLQIKADLHDLKRDHDRIQTTEGSVCEALAELRRRDPKDSPHPHRANDSADDYTHLMGRQ